MTLVAFMPFWTILCFVANRYIPLLPKWSLALGVSADTLDRACYDRAFHTLALECICYLHSLDWEFDLEVTRVAASWMPLLPGCRS